MIKHQCTCSDCHKPFFLEDAKDCRHFKKCGIGTKACPHCGNCICHGDTALEIQARFGRNIRLGKFIETPLEKRVYPDWQYQCKTIKEVEV